MIELENREIFKLANSIRTSLSASASQVVVLVPIEEDSSTAKVAVKLASALADTTETPVSLIDANFASPSIAQHAEKVSSLDTAFSSPQSFNQMVQASYAQGTFLALAPSAGSESVKTVGRLKQLKQLLQSQIGGITIVLAPTARNVVFFSEMASALNGAVIVLEANKTRRQHARTTVKELASLGLPVLGAVLTGRTYPIPDFLYDRL